MIFRAAVLGLLAGTLAAQDSSITGAVLDAGTGSPLADATVTLPINGPPRRRIQSKTDSQGRYELRGVPEGTQTVTAMISLEGRPFGPSHSRHVSVAGGQALTNIDFRIPTTGQLSGRVLDENKEPVPGISVILIAREYSRGALRFVYSNAGRTNDLGEYTVGGVRAGRAYLLMAQQRRFRLPAVADTPANPKMRRKVAAATYYPNSPDAAGAQPLTLRFGEQRDAVDIQLTRVPSYCVEGTLEANGRPAPLAFSIADASPTSGASGDGAMFMNPPNGVAGDDGKFRICELPRGNYVITASQNNNAPTFFGSMPFTIAGDDVRDLKVVPRPRMTIAGEVMFDGPAPEKPVEGKLNLNLAPMTRAPYGSESGALSAKVDIPGQFSFEGLFIDEYGFRPNAVPGNLYFKSMTYGTQSILYEPLRVGSQMGDAGIRVVMGTDGGQIGAKVTDKNGNPVGDSWVHVLPDQVVSEAMLAAAFVSGQTDQNGAWTSKSLAPGKYYVLATTGPVDKSPEDINRLWQARIRAQEVTVTKGGSASVGLSISPE
jgi:hypothetical protein